MNKTNFKKINILLFSLLMVFSFSFTKTANAQCAPDRVLYNGECVEKYIYDSLYGGGGGGTILDNQNFYEEEVYKPLANLPGYPEEGFSFDEPCPLGKFLNIFINVFIGIVAVISMIMIVMGGINYIMSDLVTSKEEAKSNIQNAIFGLIIALSAYLILNTINPSLLDLCLSNIPKSTVYIDGIAGDENAGAFKPISKENLKSLGVDCPGSGGAGALPSIARSFSNKVKYSTSSRGTIKGNSIYLDCSSFVSQVYACAGLPSPGNTTAGMFTNSNKIGSSQNTSNLVNSLTVGDLLGWRKGESSKYTTAGHVVMYIGNGKFIEVNSVDGVRERSVNSYSGHYYHLIKQ